jgi:flagellar hook protein FlgE
VTRCRSASGRRFAGITSDLTQGSIETTGVDTDVAIQGDGYFILNNNGETLYTRAGDFSTNATGDLVAQDGSIVQGYQAVNGVIPTNATLGPVSIPTGLTSPPQATTDVQLGLNLDATGGTGTVAASQQTGAGILPTSTLATGSVLAFTDGTNTFSYTTVAGDTLANVVTAINANPNFTASLNGNNLVISASNGQAITFTTNTLADTNGLTETFTPTGTYSAGIF